VVHNVEQSIGRKIIYAVIYLGICATFPALPLGGLSLIGRCLLGFSKGLGGEMLEAAKDEVKHSTGKAIVDFSKHAWDMLNPFN
jgi:hypothetical protein